MSPTGDARNDEKRRARSETRLTPHLGCSLLFSEQRPAFRPALERSLADLKVGLYTKSKMLQGEGRAAPTAGTCVGARRVRRARGAGEGSGRLPRRERVRPGTTGGAIPAGMHRVHADAAGVRSDPGNREAR